jgi:hypothetical protein
MAYLLNPNLVRESRRVRDEYVFLCDPINVGPKLFDPTIGEVVLRDVEEDPELAQSLAETEARLPQNLNHHFGLKPQVFRTTNCFGRSKNESVVLVVHSRNPVFVDAEFEVVDEDKKK